EKYAAKILLSECNILKEMVVQNSSQVGVGVGKKPTKVRVAGSDLDNSELKTKQSTGTLSNLFLASELSCLFQRVTDSELQGKENRVNILKSIDEGPFQMGNFRETLAEGTKVALHLGPERPRVYSDLSPEDKEKYNANIRETNILLQGLPKDIYSLINHYETM
ncbi:hypothetical protein Tco_1516690, partial [Tanacetum coccineum]